MVINLFHGSDHVIEKPLYNFGKDTNDFGKGFYCTPLPEMAKEWACKEYRDGYVNKYTIDERDLNILNLFEKKYNVLNWIALLLKYRKFTTNAQIAIDAKEYIINHFAIDTTNYDVIVGYRADDSYFSYAQAFIHNSLPIDGLFKALQLGQLGQQKVLISEKAFEHIEFKNAVLVDKDIYYPKYMERDTKARKDYFNEVSREKYNKEDVFVMDLLRGDVKEDDARIQRTILI